MLKLRAQFRGFSLVRCLQFRGFALVRCLQFRILAQERVAPLAQPTDGR